MSSRNHLLDATSTLMTAMSFSLSHSTRDCLGPSHASLDFPLVCPYVLVFISFFAVIRIGLGMSSQQ